MSDPQTRLALSQHLGCHGSCGRCAWHVGLEKHWDHADATEARVSSTLPVCHLSRLLTSPLPFISTSQRVNDTTAEIVNPRQQPTKHLASNCLYASLAVKMSCVVKLVPSPRKTKSGLPHAGQNCSGLKASRHLLYLVPPPMLYLVPPALQQALVRFRHSVVDIPFSPRSTAPAVLSGVGVTAQFLAIRPA